MSEAKPAGTRPIDGLRNRVRLYVGTPHACGYLPDRLACSVFVDPKIPLNALRYGSLLESGFRRSGRYVYRPACDGCRACVSVRVLAQAFAPNRTQRRCLERNADLQLSIGRRLGAEHFELYGRYLRARHADGGMDPADRQGFHHFLESSWGEAQVWSFRREGRLLAAAIVDSVPQALSAVYTFFDPLEARRSLGTFAVLRQIERAREQGLRHVYLGYWVAGSRKMDYKENFRPQETLTAQGWQLAGT